MSTVIHCPGCRAPLAIEPHMVGQLIACPACRQPIQLAAAPPSPAATRATPAPIARGSAPGSSAVPMPRPAPQGPAKAAHSNEAAARYEARRSGLPVAAVVSWAVLALLVLIAAALIWKLKTSQSDEKVAGRPARTAELAPAPLPPRSAPAAEPRDGMRQPAENQRRPAPFTPPTTRVPSSSPGSAFGAAPAPPPTAVTPPSSSTPAAAPPQAPAAPRDPLAGLPAAVRLPSLVSPVPDKLLTLAADPTEPLSIALRSLAADIPEGAAYFTEPDADGQSWAAHFVSNVEAAADKTLLGHFRLEERGLTFAWAMPLPAAALCTQLANCQAELRHGDGLHTLQLRLPLEQPQLVLDVAGDRQTLELPVADAPRADALRLEIRELAGFPSNPRIRSDLTSLPLGKETVIEFADMPGAEISLRLFRATGDAPLQLLVQSVFRESAARKFDLSLEQLDRSKEAAERGLATGKAELKIQESRLDDLQDALRRAQSNRPTNIQQLAAWQRGVNALANDVSSCTRRIRTVSRQIAEHQARLDNEPKVRSFLNSLHKRAAIRYALVAECGESEIVLIDGSRPAAAE